MSNFVKENRLRLARNLSGAAVASIVTSSLFTQMGYSGGANIRDFANQLATAVVSFGAAAVLVTCLVSRNRFMVDVALVSLLGALIGSVLKVAILEGANGVPSYIEQATQQHSWRPLIALMTDCLEFTAFLTVISLPLVTFGAWVFRVVSKQISDSPA